jgi:hypothetical protein
MNYKVWGGAAEHTARGKISLAHAIHWSFFFLISFARPNNPANETILQKSGAMRSVG